jgi:hypothetical protein
MVMKTKLMIFTLLTCLCLSCASEEDGKNVELGNGLEIYLTEKPYASNPSIDYSTVNFDTIALADTPLLRYNDLKKYDIRSHKLTLGISHNYLNIGDAGVHGRMFVVTLDKMPVYCGFNWPVTSSVPSNWVFIAEPYEALDNLKENEITISFVPGSRNDPRLDKRIVQRLKADGKIR